MNMKSSPSITRRTAGMCSFCNVVLYSFPSIFEPTGYATSDAAPLNVMTPDTLTLSGNFSFDEREPGPESGQNHRIDSNTPHHSENGSRHTISQPNTIASGIVCVKRWGQRNNTSLLFRRTGRGSVGRSQRAVSPSHITKRFSSPNV